MASFMFTSDRKVASSFFDLVLALYECDVPSTDRDAFCSLLRNLAMALRVYQVHGAKLNGFLRSGKCIDYIG
jgi:hypothetical protein